MVNNSRSSWRRPSESFVHSAVHLGFSSQRHLVVDILMCTPLIGALSGVVTRDTPLNLTGGGKQFSKPSPSWLQHTFSASEQKRCRIRGELETPAEGVIQCHVVQASSVLHRSHTITSPLCAFPHNPLSPVFLLQVEIRWTATEQH